MSPKVSIIIPAYNVEEYITQAIQSALQQTEKNIEVIIVDDASQDCTANVVKSIQDPRLHLLVNHCNSGASAARNKAIKAATGDWVALLDADDWYAPERLERLLEVLQVEPSVDIIADDLYYIKEHAALPWSTLLSESDEVIESIRVIDPVYFVQQDVPTAGSFYLGLTKPIFRREFLSKNNITYDESIEVSHDFWFYLDCLVHNAKFLFVPKPYYFYRSRHGSLVTKDKAERLDQFILAAQKFLQKEAVKSCPELEQEIAKTLALIEERIKPYYCVVDPIKRHDWWRVIISITQHPFFFLHLSSQLRKIISRRFRYIYQNLSVVK